MIASGTPAAIMARSNATPTVTIETSQPIGQAVFDSAGPLDALTIRGHRTTFRTADVARAVAIIAAQLAADRIEIRELHVQKATLEDVFLELTSAP